MINIEINSFVAVYNYGVGIIFLSCPQKTVKFA